MVRDSYAVTGARILVGTGEVIENGVLVVDDGLIVGAWAKRLEVPEGAWVIDASGKTVYPGFIDALSTLGLGAKTATRRGDTEEAKRPSPADRRIVREPSPSKRRRTSSRSRTIAVGEVEERGVHLRGHGSRPRESFPARPRSSISRESASARWSCERRSDSASIFAPPGSGRSFPASSMGVLAYVKQAFADAAHYRESWAAYEASPLGKTRPDVRPDARASGSGADRRLARAAPGARGSRDRARHRARERARGKAGALRDPRRLCRRRGALRGAKVPVLVSLKWPDRDKDADPDAEEPLRVLELRDRAPSTPGALEKAGVRFGLYSRRQSRKPEEAAANLRKAVAAGLSRERAVQALTLDAASIFGLEDRLGKPRAGEDRELLRRDMETCSTRGRRSRRCSWTGRSSK